MALALAGTLATAPMAQANDFYLARAIGEPVPAPRAAPVPAPRDATPDLPGLGTEPRTAEDPGPSESSSTTWKWVVGIAVTAAVVALAKGGDKSGGGDAVATGGDTTGGGDTSGGDGGDRLPRLPRLPGGDD